MNAPTLQLETVAIDSLTPDPKNARKHDQRNLDAISASLREFGQRKPIVVTHAGVVIAGNGTVEAAKALGWTEIAIARTPEDWSDERAKAYALADNRTAELATWDETILEATLGELNQAGWDTTSLGFEELRPDGEPDVVEDEIPEPPVEPTTKPGDIWILGDNRLMCGDSTSPADFQVLMDGKLADCIFTDPPYNVAYVGGTKDALTIKNDSMSEEEFDVFMREAYNRMSESIKAGGAIYVCHADSASNTFRRAFADAGFLLKQCLIWVKDRFVLSRQDYNWQHEPILYGWKDGAAHNWFGPFNRSTVIDDETDLAALKKDQLVQMLAEIRANSTIIREERPQRNDEHPTMKPIKLVARMVQNSTKRGDLVLDPFGGSGSTLIASAQLDRRCYTMELDPVYCDVIVKRWERLTGREAVRVGNDG